MKGAGTYRKGGAGAGHVERFDALQHDQHRLRLCDVLCEIWREAGTLTGRGALGLGM